MSDMVFQAYTNKEEHPLLFMADYLVNLNDASTIDDPELLEIQNLKQEVASFERQNKIKQEEINCLKLKIEALKRQSKNGNSSDVSMLHKKVTSDPRGSKKVKPRKPTATITSDSVSKDCETKKIDEVIPNVVTTEAPKWLLKDLSLSENSSDEDKQILNQKLLKDASDVALCPADELKETENLATTSKVSSTTNIIDTIESSVEASAEDILLTEPDHPIEESAANEQSKTQTVNNPDKVQMVIKESSDEESGEESSQSSQSSDVSQQFIIETEVGPREKPTESIKDKDVDNKAASVLAVHDASSDVRQIDIEVEPLQEVYEERQQPKTTNKPELDKVADVPPPLIQSGLIHSVMDSKLVVKSYKSINDLIVDTLSEDDFNDSENDNLMIDIDESKRIAEHDESSSSLQSSGVNVNEPACSEPPTVQFSIETMLEEMQKAPMLESSNQQPSFVPNFNHELDSIQQTSSECDKRSTKRLSKYYFFRHSD